jgi:hypothetical protein
VGSVQLYSYSCTAMQLYGHTALGAACTARETVLKSIRRTLYSYHTGLDRHVKIRARSAVAVASPCTLSRRPSVGVHIMKLAPGAPLGGGWGRCLLLQHIGVTGQAFQYDPRAQLAPASQPAVAVTQPLHAINL